MAQYTPMIEQYLEIKNQHQDAILFFRLGDFYEMFFEDAKLASRELEIVLTARDGGACGKVPMCGIPYHSASNYIAKLINRGFKIAICEQVEDPKEAKGIVKREVIRIITPGTVLEDNLLNEEKNNYLAAVIENGSDIGFAYIDISTGDFWVSEIAGNDAINKVENEICRLSPAECLLAGYSELVLKWQEELPFNKRLAITVLEEPGLNLERARSLLLRQFEVASLESFGLKGCSAGIIAAAAIVSFLDDTQKTSLKHIKNLRTYKVEQYLDMDFSTQRNLELTATLREGKREGSLLAILDSCKTAMGKRMLRRWIEQPLRELETIEQRQDAVGELKDNILLRDELKQVLSAIYDLERLSGKIGSGLANARDLIALKSSIGVLDKLKLLLTDCTSQILTELAEMDGLDDVYLLIYGSIDDEAPLSLKEGSIIKTGYNQEIDELKELSRQGTGWLLDFENREKARIGTKHLKVGFNKVFGYYIEISKSNQHLAPPDYHRKQTLVNTERFICEELKNYEDKILGARERLFSLEYQEFIKIREELVQHLNRIQQTAHKVATADVIYALAETAYINDYIRPLMDSSGVLDIKSGRHPVVEKNLKESRFVPNDIRMNPEESRFAIITGPNMGGKSTFMRQTALLVVMAQMGSFIPAEKARIGIVDKIFTRVGASDDLAAGQSTFMVEMIEAANILNNACEDSLVILDEIGRGTSTYDGLSIAQAVSEHILNTIRAKTLFATHYHELTSLADNYKGIVNLSVSVKETEETVVFLKKVLPGKADKSYGIHVACLAGLPENVIERAEDILQGLEKKPEPADQKIVFQPGLFAEISPSPVLEELKKVNVDELSPREALNLLYQWKEKVNNSK